MAVREALPLWEGVCVSVCGEGCQSSPKINGWNDQIKPRPRLESQSEVPVKSHSSPFVAALGFYSAGPLSSTGLSVLAEHPSAGPVCVVTGPTPMADHTQAGPTSVIGPHQRDCVLCYVGFPGLDQSRAEDCALEAETADRVLALAAEVHTGLGAVALRVALRT